MMLNMVQMTLQFQSTHSQGVRRLAKDSSSPLQGISIHALTRSATLLLELGFHIA